MANEDTQPNCQRKCFEQQSTQVMGSDFAHPYAEGHPGDRYYQGTEIIDETSKRRTIVLIT